jgi:hypothetical protein
VYAIGSISSLFSRVADDSLRVATVIVGRGVAETSYEVRVMDGSMAWRRPVIARAITS